MKTSLGATATLFEILEAEPKDAKRLSQIEARAYETEWSQWEMWHWTTAIDYSYVFKAMVNREIVGGIIASPTKQGSLHIDTLIVESWFRKQGIGTALLRAAINARGFNEGQKIVLHTQARKENRPVVRLYEKFGFKTVGRTPDYYHQGIDYLLMERQGAWPDPETQTPKDVATSIVNELKGKPPFIYGKGKRLLDELSNITSEHKFDGFIDDFYDFCDEQRVWLGF